MVKKALTLLTSILIALHLLMPFNIYADSITNSNVLGINTVLLSKSQNVALTNSWFYVYQHTITLDADYIGTITLDVNLTYIAPSGSSSTYSTSTINNKTYFVNGNTITINQTVTSDNFGNQGPIVSSSYLLKSSNVVKTSTITELQQIIDLLTDIYNSNDNVEGLLNNQLEQLELIVANTSLANDYLETLTKIRQWNVPFESLNANFFVLSRVGIVNGYSLYDFFNNQIYSYPIYLIDSGLPVCSNNVSRYKTAVNNSFLFIFGIKDNPININNVYSVLNLNQDLTVDKIEYITTMYFYNNGSGSNISFYRLKVTNNTSSNISLNISFNNRTMFIPIYLDADNVSQYNISTEFALQWGLSNRLLDDVHLIANGTTASQSASQSSDSANSQLQTESNTLFQQENGFKSDMNNAMQNVDTTFRLENMGTKFVSSAQWVRTQYERLTNNTPFASLITFSLITGLALILLGKVYK